MKVALASTATLLKLLESQTAESIVFASLLWNTPWSQSKW
jgi:hypothetical protein